MAAVVTDTDSYAELEAALTPIRAAQPGITMQEAAPLLPEHLRRQMWERAVDRYLNTALAEVDAEPKRPTRVTTVATTLDAEVDR